MWMLCVWRQFASARLPSWSEIPGGPRLPSCLLLSVSVCSVSLGVGLWGSSSPSLI